MSETAAKGESRKTHQPSPYSSANTAPQYKAPAHKHAHHLHSIPPREKSTRTLIIDHMLWVHARTRFAQARAELSMTDRTGGPSSSNYTHRHRPENYEEDDELGSEGEDVGNLKARLNPPGHFSDAERTRQDLSLARSLRLRAEGLEKVVTSMLDRPPPIHPVVDDDIVTAQPPSSPKLSPASARDLHKLPNGVRLRLALGTIINDLFARQMPRPPYRYTHPPGCKSSTSMNTSRSSPELSLSALPASLAPLSSVSGSKALHSHNTPQAPPTSPVYPHRRSPPPHPTPTQRTISLYYIGASPLTIDPTTTGFRCPRHLHTQCEICVEAKSTSGIGRSAPGGTANLAAANNMRGRSNSVGQNVRGAVPGSGWRGIAVSNGTTGGSLSGWQDGAGIGSGLSTLDIGGCALRRKVRDWDVTMADGHDPCGAGNTKLSRLIPRFLRLSALVAVELGEEARDEEEEREAKLSANVGAELSGSDFPATSADGASDAGSLQGLNQLYEIAFRPTREWYLLLAGLLTRAVLEGYLTGGWRGLQAVECLLTLGLAMDHGTTSEEGNDAMFEEFDPDDLPTLPDAVKLLFPSLRDNNGSSRPSAAEDEYETEMFERLKRFYDVRQSAPDLTTLMEDIAWQYPAEPVERAALRFCEAIARWRGKPELETYKKKAAPSTPGLSTVHRQAPSTQNSIAGNLTFAVPAPRRARHKPSIDIYFTQQAWQESPWVRPGKRPRSMSSARMQESPPKRMQI
ncbi:hypothetical protein APHAL10511_008070 [Amanita phalloides]|nr:hypothetical protein APHAL10511_008070 [Amanita phalloides]